MNDDRAAASWPEFSDRAVRAAVVLHEEQMWRLLDEWRRARTSGARLPEIADPDYASYEALLSHVYRWAGTYLVWVCDRLDLPGPTVEPVPHVDSIAAAADSYLEHLLEAWRRSLSQVVRRSLGPEVYPAPWGAPYGVEAMLEHAVVHPMKHHLQLAELLRDAGR